MRKPVHPENYVFGFRLDEIDLLKRGRELNLGRDATEWEVITLIEKTARRAYVLPARALDIRAELFAVKRTPKSNDGQRLEPHGSWFLALGSNVPRRQFAPPSKEKIQEVMELLGLQNPPRWAHIY